MAAAWQGAAGCEARAAVGRYLTPFAAKKACGRVQKAASHPFISADLAINLGPDMLLDMHTAGLIM